MTSDEGEGRWRDNGRNKGVELGEGRNDSGESRSTRGQTGGSGEVVVRCDVDLVLGKLREI